MKILKEVENIMYDNSKIPSAGKSGTAAVVLLIIICVLCLLSVFFFSGSNTDLYTEEESAAENTTSTTERTTAHITSAEATAEAFPQSLQNFSAFQDKDISAPYAGLYEVSSFKVLL